jgi:hypothetical protein
VAVRNQIMAASAIVYIPAGPTIGLNLARQYWRYVQQRGYELYAVARSLGVALDELSAGKVQVVVMLTPDVAPLAEPGMTTVVVLESGAHAIPEARRRNGRVWLPRLTLGQDVNELPAAVGLARSNVRRIDDEGDTVRLPSAGYVRSVLFGEDPAPSGLDPEMIAAARRIARRLGD